MRSEDKVGNASDINSIVCAKIPDMDIDSELYDTYM